MGSYFEADNIIDAFNFFQDEQFLPTLKTWSLHDLSRIIGIGNWPGAALNRQINEAFVKVIEEKLSEGAELDKQLLFCFARLFIDRPNESWSLNLMQKIAAEFLSACSKNEKFSIKEVSKLANGFSKWPNQECCQKAMKEIASIIRKDLPTAAADITEEDVSEFAIVLIKWRDEDWIEDTMKVISDVAIKKVKDGRRFTKEGLESLAFAFSKWHDTEWSFEVVKVIAICCLGAFDAGYHYYKEELYSFAIAFSEFADRNSTSIYNVMQCIHEDFRSKYIEREEFTARQLCNFALAFNRWPEETWSYEPIERFSTDYDVTVFDSLKLNTQVECDLAKVFSKHSKEKWSIAYKLPFIHLASESHKKPTPIERLLKKFRSFRQNLSKKVEVDL